MPAHAFAWRTHYAILFFSEISHVSKHKNRHNVSLIFTRNVTTPTLRRVGIGCKNKQKEGKDKENFAFCFDCVPFFNKKLIRFFA